VEGQGEGLLNAGALRKPGWTA